MTFDEFLKLLTEFYHDHHIAPGVQLAWLTEKAQFYGAVHVFPAGLQSRTVLIKAIAPTSGEVVTKLYHNWCAVTNQDTVPVTDADGSVL